MQANLPSRCDVLIVGAGPAGNAAAIELARAGFDTVLIEKHSFPREKVCGCCLNRAAAAELQALGATEVLESWIPAHTLEIRAAGVTALLPHLGGVISRGRLDSMLLTLARRLGVSVFTEASAMVQPQIGADTQRVAVHMDGSIHPIDASCVIAADGIGGTSLRSLPQFGWTIDPEGLIGLGCLCTGTSGPPPGRIVMGIGASGYIGVVRLEKGLFDVAAAIRPEAVRSSGGGSQALCRLMEQAGMSGGLEPVGCHGTPRLTRTRLAVEGERLIVAGDASAYVEPFTGEGMSWALWSGRRAALWAEGIVRGVKPVWRWADELDRGLRKRRLACRLVAHVLRERDRCEGIIEVAATVPRLSAWISGRFGRPWPQPVDGARR